MARRPSRRCAYGGDNRIGCRWLGGRPKRKARSMSGEGLRHDVPDSENEAPAFDTSVAHVARVYDYWLGGKDNFAADRAAGDQAINAFPDIVLSARSNRAFLARAVRFLAEE